MSENILLIIKEKEQLKPKIAIAPGVLLQTNRVLNTKPISPIVGKQIKLQPKPVIKAPIVSKPTVRTPVIRSIPIRRRRMGMNFL